MRTHFEEVKRGFLCNNRVATCTPQPSIIYYSTLGTSLYIITVLCVQLSNIQLSLFKVRESAGEMRSGEMSSGGGCFVEKC